MTIIRRLKPFGTFLFFSWTALAQTSASLAGADYAKPGPFLVAPGQIMNFFFRGISSSAGGIARSADAAGVPLPTKLAGLALSVSQPGLDASLAVPILSVRQERECDGDSAECLLTSIRAQVPFELAASTTPRLGAQGSKAPDAQLTVEEDGRPSRSFLLRPVSENGHVLTSCDLAADANPESVCTRAAYHADGSRVDLDRPAVRGESIVVYAYGLGQTVPAAKSGEPSAAGLSVMDNPQSPRVFVTVHDQFLNVSGSTPRAFLSEPYNLPPARIDFAGLTPGQIGVYQINVPIPSTFQVPVPCGPDASIGAVRSNGFLQVTTAQGTENVPICVWP